MPRCEGCGRAEEEGVDSDGSTGSLEEKARLEEKESDVCPGRQTGVTRFRGLKALTGATLSSTLHA